MRDQVGPMQVRPTPLPNSYGKDGIKQAWYDQSDIINLVRMVMVHSAIRTTIYDSQHYTQLQNIRSMSVGWEVHEYSEALAMPLLSRHAMEGRVIPENCTNKITEGSQLYSSTRAPRWRMSCKEPLVTRRGVFPHFKYHKGRLLPFKDIYCDTLSPQSTRMQATSRK